MGKRRRKLDPIGERGNSGAANGSGKPPDGPSGAADAVAGGSGDGSGGASRTVVDLGATGAGAVGGSGGADDGNTEPRAKRSYTRRATSSKVDISALLADNLFTVHAFLAAMTGKEIFKLEQDEADKVGQAIQNVARHYDLPGIEQRTVDWVALARTIGLVYGGRIFAARMMAKSAPKANSLREVPKPETPSAPPGHVMKEVYPGGPSVAVPAAA